MSKIQIGNDFRVRWELTQHGQPFDIVGKDFELTISNPYGTIVATEIITDGNVLSFTIPASQQVYIGNYNIELKITDEKQSWTLRQCDAFTLCPCCDDDVEVVQLNSGIVYPANGLSAYELAVLDGYQGTYDEWIELYHGLEKTTITLSGVDTDFVRKDTVVNQDINIATIL